MSNNVKYQVRWKSPAGTDWQELPEDAEAKSWEALQEIHKYFREQADFTDDKGRRPNKLIFRGQGFHENLKTSLERAFEEFDIHGNDRWDQEKQLIRSFQRKAPYYLKGVGVPSLNDTLEWLSLMQHYGAPTRLLDFTYSFYRALYNAVSKDSRKDKLWGEHKSELWVMNTRWFTDKTEGNPKYKVSGILRENLKDIPENSSEGRKQKKELLCALRQEKIETIDYVGKLTDNRSKLVQYLMDIKNPLPLVYNVTPIGLNERMIYQQGTFVLPGDITKSFMQNLEPYRKDNCQEHLYRIVITLGQQERNRIIEELNDMNINEAVLFPGLDGFARSLRLKLAFYDKR